MISVSRKSRKNIRACCIDVGNKSLISRCPHAMDVTARVVQMLNLVSWASTFHADLVSCAMCFAPRLGWDSACLPAIPWWKLSGTAPRLGKGFWGC